MTVVDVAAGPEPELLLATTLNVYDVPPISPVRVALVLVPDTPMALAACEPMYAVTKYCVTGVVELAGAAHQLTEARLAPAAAAALAGAPGAPAAG